MLLVKWQTKLGGLLALGGCIIGGYKLRKNLTTDVVEEAVPVPPRTIENIGGGAAAGGNPVRAARQVHGLQATTRSASAGGARLQARTAALITQSGVKVQWSSHSFLETKPRQAVEEESDAV